MVTTEKQNGTIKINDLELAGSLLGFQHFIFGSLPTSSQERVKKNQRLRLHLNCAPSTM